MSLSKTQMFAEVEAAGSLHDYPGEESYTELARRLEEEEEATSAFAGASGIQVGGQHYVSKAVQPWDAMAAWMAPEEFIGYLRGNVIKYLARCWDKGGIDDLRKAKHYLEKLIETVEKANHA